MANSPDLTELTDADLLVETQRAAGCERDATARLIAFLAEVDARRLYLGLGCASLFTYCTRVLHLSEHAAYGRIEAARASRRWPVLLERLGDGSLTLTAAALLAPHLTPENHLELLDAARHKPKRDVEQLVAALRPKPDVHAFVRKLPEPARSTVPIEFEPRPNALDSVAPPSEPPARPSVVAPLAPARFKVQLTIGRETYDKLRRVQDLLRHSIPNGDPSQVFDRALTVLLGDLERAKIAASEHPRASRPPASSSRHISAAVRREVWKRDGGQCAFVGTEGRCTERGFLEFHHVDPYAAGGPATVHNIELRCRAHNMYEAATFFGSRWPLLLREPTRQDY